ncbi:MAG: elongator complex protein 3 [Clostridia bacterium]|jgi:histone acetyltransferase (RNA polymerase elongator complex component)
MAKDHYIIPFFIPHTGCPHHCVFCSQNKITGKERPVLPEHILTTVREYIATFPRDAKRVEVAFFGGSFTGIPLPLQNAFLGQAYAAKRKGLIDGIRLSTRPDYINNSILDNLKGYGVDTVELGVQSMNNRVLDLSQRGHTAEDVAYASRLIRGYGFNLGLQMMVGLPGSDREAEIETAERVCALGPDFVRIYPALIIRGTALEEMYRAGTYRPLPLGEAVDVCVTLAEMFARERIKVIRMGLQPTDMINEEGEVVAGPFHPSFRQLVDSRLLLKVVSKVIDQRGLNSVGELVIEANPRTLPTLQGIGKESIKSLREAYPRLAVKVTGNRGLGQTVLRIISGDGLSEVDYRRVLEKGI